MRSLLRLVPIALLLCAPALAATDWPHLRGPSFDGRIAGTGVFDLEDVGLETAWRVPLGSGYSGIAVAEGRAVTSFTDGDGDWVGAFDAASGESIWRHRLGDVFVGQDGSDDGPLSSPVIAAGHVFALTPRGALVALRLKDGKLAWTKGLADEFGSEAPHFGFTTTPVPAGDVLVLMAGGAEGKTIVGLDVRTGKTVWSHGDQKVDYQSPAVMTLAGKQQVVALAGKKITGLSADKGEPLWEHALGEQERSGSANPTFIGENRFLIGISGDAAVFRVTGSQGSMKVEELYRSKVLGNTYAKPVYHDGHVYGFRGKVLNCMRAEDGERVWRSREPGGEGVILVDGHLVMFASRGNVVVAEASPEGYRETARVRALDGSSLTWPSFADGRVFVRNLREMAAVSFVEGGSRHFKTVVGGDALTEFGRWLERLATSNDRSKMIDELLARHSEMPIVEDKWVHFVYRGEAEDVGVTGSMMDSDGVAALQRVEGTDLFHHSMELEPGTRWEYQFQIDFETWTPDPLNPRSVPAQDGDAMLSELVMPGYVTGKHLAEPQGARGRVDTLKLESKTLGYEKEVKVWLPPGYDDSEASYPLLVVNDGHHWLDKGLMANTLDNLVGSRVEPLVVAFVPATGAWWTEAGGSRTEEYVAMLAKELVPALQEKYRLAERADARGLMGNQFYGFAAAYAALRYPETFGKAAVQSVYTGLGFLDELQALVDQRVGPDVRFYLDWNRFDAKNVDRDWDFAEDSRKLAELLQSGGYRVKGGEVNDSAGWGGWRNRTDRVLAALFPVSSR